jgi:RNA polymerase sigma-70 factor (ECF subfamily)
MSETADLASLLQHSIWMRRLARSLVRDDAAADDLVQETWLQAVRNPPRAGDTTRPWLGEVLRNVFRAGRRSDARRHRREDAANDPDARAPTPDELVGAVELQQLLAEEVLRLEDPYRSTLLMIFYEGLSPSELAAREGVPAGTVRWRLKEGLEKLRAQLDRRHAGQRAAWMGALAPLTGNRGPLGAPLLKGASLMKILLVSALAAGVGVTTWTLEHKDKQPPAPSLAKTAQPPVAAPPAAVPKPPPHADRAERAALLKKIDDARRAAHPGVAPTVPPPPIDADYVRNQIKDLLPLVQECFENALVTHPNLEGRILVSFSIVGDPSVGGLVADSHVVDDKSTIQDPGVRECIQETMYAARFPPPPEGGEVKVEYPFVLLPAPPDEEEDPLKSPEAQQRLEKLLQTGHFPDGTPLSDEQKAHLKQLRK